MKNVVISALFSFPDLYTCRLNVQADPPEEIMLFTSGPKAVNVVFTKRGDPCNQTERTD